MQPTRITTALATALAVAATGWLATACNPGTATCYGRQATIVGSAGNDILNGTDGPDVIAGLGGHDTIRGLGGDDVICADGTTAGNDSVSGGSGTDWVSFEESRTGGMLDLAAGTSSIQGLDLLSEVENVAGGPAADQLRGNAAANRFVVSKTDSVEGRGGDDVVEGACNDCDLAVSYESAPGPVTVDLATGASAGAAGRDLFLVRPARILGGAYADNLSCGTAGPSCITIGGGGADNITGTALGDTFLGGAGNDRITGNGGSDEVRYEDSPGPVHVDLGAGTATGHGTDTLVGIRMAWGSRYDDLVVGNTSVFCTLQGGGGNDWLVAGYGGCSLSGGPGNDTLTGSGYKDILVPDGYGTPGNDRVTGGGSDDLVHGDGGNDVLDGGEGHDTVDYVEATGAIQADLSTGKVTGSGTDTLTSFERIEGTSGADTIHGTPSSDYIDARTGNDTVFGGGGNDYLYAGDGTDWMHGGEGDDQLVGSTGDDTLYGGGGRDMAAFQAVPTGPIGVGATADLGNRRASGPSGNDWLFEFEDLHGTEWNDVLIGDAGPNLIEGGSGIDSCSGGGGADVVRNCP